MVEGYPVLHPNADGQRAKRRTFRCSTASSGPVFSAASACASANDAISTAYNYIAYGDAIAMITGGSEATVSPLAVGGFASMRAMSTRNDDPTRASRPFDRERDGFVLGEGAGVLVLEEYEHAKARGAQIYCEMLRLRPVGRCVRSGRGRSGRQRACCLALHARVREIGHRAQRRRLHQRARYVDADRRPGRIESHRKSFRRARVRVSASVRPSRCTATRSAAAGGIEGVATVMAVADDIMPPTINYEFPDPECTLDYVPNIARQGAGSGGAFELVRIRRSQQRHRLRQSPLVPIVAGEAHRRRLARPASACGGVERAGDLAIVERAFVHESNAAKNGRRIQRTHGVFGRFGARLCRRRAGCSSASVNEPEGMLTLRKAAIVNDAAARARPRGGSDFASIVQLGAGMRASGGAGQTSILADAFEAFVAARLSCATVLDKARAFRCWPNTSSSSITLSTICSTRRRACSITPRSICRATPVYQRNGARNAAAAILRIRRS